MMDALAFDATKLIRPALLTIVLYLPVILIAMMMTMMIKPAHASGTVSPIQATNNVGFLARYTLFNSYGYSGTLAEMQAAYNAWLALPTTVCYNQNGYVDCSSLSPFSQALAGPFYDSLCPAGYVSGGSDCHLIYPASACPAHATGTPVDLNPTTCTCNSPTALDPTNYMPDATGTSCVAVPACPAHSSGTPPSCVCDAGYQFDATRTSCIPEPYTIALSGLGGEVMTNATRAAYALVTTSSGSPKSGVHVDLALTVVPELNGQLPVTYTGYLSGSVGAIGSITYAGTTGADGRLSFVFTAPVAGGLHTITATCVGCTNNPVTGTIRVPGCMVEDMIEPPANDECAQSLDAGLGKDVNGKCPKLDPRLPDQMQCFANKIAATNATASPSIPYSGPTAKYRNAAYQAHLKDIWDKMQALNNDVNRNNEACRPLRDKVIAEKGCDSSDGCPGECVVGSHCVRSTPATFSNHTQGTAFDVSKDTINGLLRELTQIPLAPTLQAQRIWIADWLAKPTACNLYWGGNFNDPPDFVHFQLP